MSFFLKVSLCGSGKELMLLGCGFSNNINNDYRKRLLEKKLLVANRIPIVYIKPRDKPCSHRTCILLMGTFSMVLWLRARMF
jgi:hypothetical protein